MVVTFKTTMPLEQTMLFERVYEENLRLTLDEKIDLLEKGYAVWMFVDGVIAGETYSVNPAAANEDIEDVEDDRHDTLYCYSTTILPAFQGRGLAKILVAYSIGQARAAGFARIVGHATSPGMVAVRAFFGARFGRVHERWYDTDRIAHFYRIELG